MTTRLQHPSGQIPPIFVSIEEAARLLGASPWTIRKMVGEQKLRSRKDGKRRKIEYASVVQYAESLPREESAEDTA